MTLDAIRRVRPGFSWTCPCGRRFAFCTMFEPTTYELAMLYAHTQLCKEARLPYIEHDDRQRAVTEPRTPGELNFAFTELIRRYIERKGKNYTHLNDCLGALEGAKLEFYRRVVVPYEEVKREQNPPDVY